MSKGGESNAGYLWAVRVLGSFQNRGLGERLMRAAETALYQRGYRFAELAVETWNVNALRFYERLGFRIIDRVRTSQGYQAADGISAVREGEEWLLRKELEKPRPGVRRRRP